LWSISSTTPLQHLYSVHTCMCTGAQDTFGVYATLTAKEHVHPYKHTCATVQPILRHANHRNAFWDLSSTQETNSKPAWLMMRSRLVVAQASSDHLRWCRLHPASQWLALDVHHQRNQILGGSFLIHWENPLKWHIENPCSPLLPWVYKPKWLLQVRLIWCLFEIYYIQEIENRICRVKCKSSNVLCCCNLFRSPISLVPVPVERMCIVYSTFLFFDLAPGT